jgi:uncharacterized protein
MQRTLLWTSQEYHSKEYCTIRKVRTGTEVNSVILGMHKKTIYKIDYQTRINKNGETIFVEIKFDSKDPWSTGAFQSDGEGHWTRNGKSLKRFDGCIDIDISLTPFTNSLPVNRLKLENKEQQFIKVIYFDILQKRVTTARQSYSRLSKYKYLYENVPHTFQATISVDGCGMVLDYPGLFSRAGTA